MRIRFCHLFFVCDFLIRIRFFFFVFFNFSLPFYRKRIFTHLLPFTWLAFTEWFTFCVMFVCVWYRKFWWSEYVKSFCDWSILVFFSFLTFLNVMDWFCTLQSLFLHFGPMKKQKKTSFAFPIYRKTFIESLTPVCVRCAGYEQTFHLTKKTFFFLLAMDAITEIKRKVKRDKSALKCKMRTLEKFQRKQLVSNSCHLVRRHKKKPFFFRCFYLVIGKMSQGKAMKHEKKCSELKSENEWNKRSENKYLIQLNMVANW